MSEPAKARAARPGAAGLGADAMHVYVADIAYKPAQNGSAAQQIQRSESGGLADDDLGYVVLPGDAQERRHEILADRCDDLGAQFARQRQVALEADLFLLRERLADVHVHRE